MKSIYCLIKSTFSIDLGWIEEEGRGGRVKCCRGLLKFLTLACLVVQQLAFAGNSSNSLNSRLEEALRAGKIKNAKVIAKLMYRRSSSLNAETDRVMSILFNWLHQKDEFDALAFSSQDRTFSESLRSEVGVSKVSLQQKRKFVADVFVERVVREINRGSRIFRAFEESLGQIDLRSQNQEEAESLQRLVALGFVAREELSSEELARLLFVAVRFSLRQLAQILISDPRLNIEELRGGFAGPTILDLAVSRSDIEMFNILLSHPDMDLNFKSIFGAHILSSAVSRGDPEILELLLNHPSYLFDEDRSEMDANNALHTAAQEDNFELGRLLVEKYHYPLSAKNLRGESPVFIALSHGSGDWLLRFMESGYDFDFSERDKRGMISFEVALKNRQTKAIRLLLKSAQSSSFKLSLLRLWTPLLENLIKKARSESSIRIHGQRHQLELLILLEDLQETFKQVAQGLGLRSIGKTWE